MKTKIHLGILGLLLNFLFMNLSSYAQPSIQWQKCFGGTAYEASYFTSKTNDGGFIMVGETNSSNGNVSGFHGGINSDIWVVKVDLVGNIQWQKCLGGDSTDIGYYIIQTSDNGYMVAGTSVSNNGDVSGNHGSFDVWLVKLDSLGNLQWQKSLGGTLNEEAESIFQTSDGGYMLFASASSNNGDVSGNHGNGDVWMVKLDVNGNLQWQKCLGGTGTDGKFGGPSALGSNFRRVAVGKTNDGGYIIGTMTSSNDGDVSGHHGIVGSTYFDCWVFKSDSMGIILWQKSLGGTGNSDFAQTIFQTNDGGYIVAGLTNSNDGDVSGNHGGADIWVVKLNPIGSIQWQKCLGGTGIDLPYSISLTQDGGYFVAGQSSSLNGYVAGCHGSRDAWVVKLDSLSNMQWQKCLGGTSLDVSSSAFQTSDGGYIVAGHTNSNNFDVSGNHGSGPNWHYDCWLVKLSPLPGNVISGNVFEDLNKNCIKDSNEVGLFGKIIEAMPGNYITVTDANGNYSLFVDSGAYIISHFPSQYYNQSCPLSSGTYTVHITSLTPNSYGNDFADTLTSHCADIKLSVGYPLLRWCFRNSIKVFYSNIGAVAATNVNITLNFDSVIIPISSTIPWTIVGNNYVFSIDTIKSGQSGSFTIFDSVSCASMSNSHLACVFAVAHSTTAECDTNNNVAHDCHLVVSSCDPNAKEVAFSDSAYSVQKNCIATDTLTYMIRFQNTGTDTAFTVIIRDTLSNYLDAASVESGASSHPYSFRIYGQGILEWTFNNILLPDSTSNEVASHGFVKFNIRQKPNNPQGTMINNCANIVFDYNAPVITDTAVVTIYQQTTIISSTKNQIKGMIIYPNPSNGIITLRSETNIELVVIYNSLGEIVYNEKTNSTQQQISLSNQPSGIYFLKVSNQFLKVIKE